MSLHDPHLFRELIKGFPSIRVLCIGDIMLDRFIYGKVDRISPEAPVPVFHIHRETQSLGGAGNVVQNLASLGAQVSFISVVGNDLYGLEIESHLDSLSTVQSHLVKEAGRISTLKMRYLASGQQLIRADHEQVSPVSPASQQDIKAFIADSIEHIDVVILSDYGKGLLTPDLIQWIIQHAHQHARKVIVDPKGTNYTIYKGADLITPNAKELAQASRHAVSTDQQVIEAAQLLREQCGIKSVLATRGEKGMTLVADAGHAVHLPTQALEVYDVSGAGDTVISVVGACLAQQADLATAAMLANIAAGLVVAKVGTASLSPSELMASLESIPHSYSQDKVLSLEAGVQKVIEWHRKGLRVGFTNGCFDLLHPGHILLIQEAKKNCDRLMIGLNTDNSVKRLKGPARPVNHEQARAAVLSALADVDHIILFDEDTPHHMIKTLRPDVLVKGSDYTIEQIVGAQEVLGWGGDVLRVDLKPGFSTTGILAKALEQHQR